MASAESAPGPGARRLAVFAVAPGIFLAALALGETGASARMTLADALALAEQQNPSLKARAQAIESSRAAEVTAGLRPNPTFQNDTTSATLGVYQEIEVGGKRRARLESARLATSMSQTDFADARRTLVYNVRQAFVGALLGKANAALARENLTTFGKVVDLNRLRFESGALSGADLQRIELQMLQFQTDLEEASVALDTAKATLRALLGGSLVPEDFDVEGELEATPFEKTLPELERLALANRPDLRSAETEVQKAAADFRLARANGYPDPTIGTSLLHTGNEVGGPSWFQPFYPKGETSNAMGLGISFPLPVFNRNQGEIARTSSEQRRAQFLAEATRNQVVQDVDSAYAAFQSSRERVRWYEQTYLSRAKDSRDTAEFAYEKGATSALELLDAERTYRATELAYRRELAAYETNLAQLDAAVGKAVIP